MMMIFEIEHVLLCCFYVILMNIDNCKVDGSSERFLEQPTSVIIPETLMGNVSFTCSAITSETCPNDIYWLINDTIDSSQSVKDLGITTKATFSVNEILSNLSIPVRISNNNTMVQCVVIDGCTREEDRSSTVSVVIFPETIPFCFESIIERLSAPTQFRITRQDKSDINLSWSRPMNEDISFTAFNLCWVNRASNKAGSRLLPPDITEFTFTEGVSVCDVIEFTVRAVNGEGAGNSSEPIQGHLFGAPVVVSALPPVVEFDDETLQVNFAINIGCKGTQATVFLLMLESNSGGSYSAQTRPSTFFTQIELLGSETFWQTTMLTIDSSVLADNTIYSTSITAVNSEGSSNLMTEITVSTFDVQWASVDIANSTGESLQFCISCTFAKGSESDGCQTMFPSLRQDFDFTVLRQSATTYTIMQCFALSVQSLCSEAVGSGKMSYSVHDYPLNDNSITPAVTGEVQLDSLDCLNTSSELVRIISITGSVVFVILVVLLMAALIVLIRCIQRRKNAKAGAKPEPIYEEPQVNTNLSYLVSKPNSQLEALIEQRTSFTMGANEAYLASRPSLTNVTVEQRVIMTATNEAYLPSSKSPSMESWI